MIEERIDFRRYIKDFESENVFKNYYNDNFIFLLDVVGENLGYVNEGQIEYAKVKKAICRYINKNFGNYNVSKKQINKLVKPQKNIVSKYAPLYLIAIYDMLIKNWPQTLHTDICCRKQYDKTYSEFAIAEFIKFKEQCSWKNPGDDLIKVFDNYLGIVNSCIPGNLGEEFSNEHLKNEITV